MTHTDLSVGHQITQTAHVIAELAVAHPEHFRKWHDVSQSIIVLQTPTAESLTELYVQARYSNITVQPFREPDLGDEITALAFLPGPNTVRFLASLPLAGKKVVDQEQARKAEASLKKISLQVQDSEEFKRGRLLREHYFAFLDHLHGHLDLNEYLSWNLPRFSPEERLYLLRNQPRPWVMDRALTFFFLSPEHKAAYADDSEINTVFDKPETISGWNFFMSTFNRKESL